MAYLYPNWQPSWSRCFVSCKRKSDVSALDVGEHTFSPEGVTFNVSQRPFVGLTIEHFRITGVCPVACLRQYEHCTLPCRDARHTPLFLSLRPPRPPTCHQSNPGLLGQGDYIQGWDRDTSFFFFIGIDTQLEEPQHHRSFLGAEDWRTLCAWRIGPTSRFSENSIFGPLLMFFRRLSPSFKLAVWASRGQEIHPLVLT